MKRRDLEIERVIRKWGHLLGLTNWKIFVKKVKNPNGAEVAVDYVYLRAKVWLHDSIPIEEIEEYLLHELLHIVIGYHYRKYVMEMYEAGRISGEELKFIRMGEEGLVETLVRAFLAVERKGGDKDVEENNRK